VRAWFLAAVVYCVAAVQGLLCSICYLLVRKVVSIHIAVLFTAVATAVCGKLSFTSRLYDTPAVFMTVCWVRVVGVGAPVVLGLPQQGTREWQLGLCYCVQSLLDWLVCCLQHCNLAAGAVLSLGLWAGEC